VCLHPPAHGGIRQAPKARLHIVLHMVHLELKEGVRSTLLKVRGSSIRMTFVSGRWDIIRVYLKVRRAPTPYR
jgi:hypothetical protein